MFIRGLSLITGGFPDEEYLSFLFFYKEMDEIKRVITGPSLKFFILIAFFFITSVVIQFKTFTKEDGNRSSGNYNRTAMNK